MFYNNKGAIHLINKNYNEAFSYFQHAINADPYFSGSWANLGILYRVHGYYDIAERSYTQAYKIDKNKTAWGNLALLYRKTGRIMQANKIENQLD